MNSYKFVSLFLLSLLFTFGLASCGKGSVPQQINPLVVTTRGLPTAIINKSYSTMLTASGGQTPYTWSITSGSLPAGISMTPDGTISGTATSTGSSSITVQVTDSQSPTKALATGSFTLTVNNPLAITTKTLKNGAINVPYNVTLMASGGAPLYTWTLVSGSLPAGLSLLSGGSISGTPTAEGTSSFTLQVADSENPPVTATQDYTLTIGGAVGRLSGNYVLSFRGFKDGKAVLQAGSFISDGTGDITSGTVDIVSVTGLSGSNHTMVPIHGTYTLDDAGHGSMMLMFGNGNSANYQIVASTNGYFSFIQDGDGQANQAGSGIIFSQSTIPTDLTSFGGSAGSPWVFGGYGADVGNARYAAAGTFSLSYTTGNTQGTISSGLLDSNDNGTYTTGSAFTGTIQPPDATTGRGTASLVGGQSTNAIAYYYVGSSNGSLQLVGISTGAVTINSPIVLYTLRRQVSLGLAGGGYTNAALQGTVISELSSVPSQTAPDVSLGLLDFDGKSAVYATIDDNNGGTYTQKQQFTGTYSVDSTGRTTFTGWGGTVNPVMYLWSFEDGFVLGNDPAVTYGEIEFQAIASNTHTPGNGDFNGTYSGGTLAPVLASQTVEVDTDNADGAGNLTVNYDIAGGGNPPQQGLSYSATYNIDTSCPPSNTYGYTTCGRFPVLDSNKNQIGVGYLVDIFTKNRVVVLNTSTKQPVINAAQK
jgi:hypothetical protein